jgi:hypothetical protein
MNCKTEDVPYLDDEFATYCLIYTKEYSNFERRFGELKANELKRK